MYKKYGKRFLDILIASVALIIFIIPMAIIALWIKLDSKGPAIFKQKRSGKNNVPFTIYKFRTMGIDAPSSVATRNLFDSKNYITRLGKTLRKFSIDELPQIINVILGDMSIVGPRPVIISESSLIQLREGSGAHTLRPGVTGWAQINGRDLVDDISKSEMDGWYAKNISLRTDLICILTTVLTIVTAAGQSEGQEINKSTAVS